MSGNPGFPGALVGCAGQDARGEIPAALRAGRGTEGDGREGRKLYGQYAPKQKAA